MERITFNTHRSYTPEGQVIVAEVKGSGILFNDTSRMVFGEIEVNDAHQLRDITRWPHRFIMFVLNAYDHNAYSGISTSDAPKRVANETMHHFA